MAAAEVRSEKAASWSEHIEAWQRSGLSQGAYCRRHGLSQSSLRSWRKHLGDTEMLTPRRPKISDTPCQRRNARRRFRRRAAIEPVIGHVKQDHRLARNFLKGVLGDAINLFMAAAAFNFRKWMRKVTPFFALVVFNLLNWSKTETVRQAGI